MIKIYSLTHPSSPRVYIGKTVQTLGARFNSHIREAKFSLSHNRRLNWIRKLIKNGFKPEIKLIAIAPDEYVKDAEIGYIAWGWQKFPNDMLNDPNFPGGDGCRIGYKHPIDSVLKRSGENAPQSKLTYAIANEIREKYSTGKYKHSDLAKEYNVSKTMIGNVIRNKYWQDDSRKHDIKLWGRKLSNEQLTEIASRINNGEYIKDLAKEYGVSRSNLWANLKGKVNGTIELKYKTDASINNLKFRQVMKEK